jgi:hypothetical protein
MDQSASPIHEGTDLKSRQDAAFKTFPVRSDIATQIRRAVGGIPFSAEVQVTLALPELEDSFPLENLAGGILGRINPGSAANPDFDLTPYEAQEKGVSRRHAMLIREPDGLFICDLGSLNGTYVNGQRIAPQQPCPLQDGDEVRLARLVLLIRFNMPG